MPWVDVDEAVAEQHFDLTVETTLKRSRESNCVEGESTFGTASVEEKTEKLVTVLAGENGDGRDVWNAQISEVN